MKRELFLDCAPDYVRAAVIKDGKLCEIHTEAVSSAKLTESLFCGRITGIRLSVCAAFVDIGLELNAFLPLSEIENKKLKCGDFLIVQGAAKQATDSKGLRITTKINLAGSSLVLVPGQHDVRISKKIQDETLREQLLEAGRLICPPDCGLIIRTASQNLTMELLRDEVEALEAKWRQACLKAEGMTKPGLILERTTLEERLLRDLAGVELARIVTNSRASATRMAAWKSKGFLREETAVELFAETDRLIFDAYALEDQIERALKKRVWLPCGGYLVMDSCEAMTVIDVNSGKMMLGKDAEDTAFRVNMEAAREVAHQIRLRDISGMIVVDFIDMKDNGHRQALVRALRDSVRADRSQVKVYGLTHLGLMEMTRKRVHAQLHKKMHVSCSYCSGTGEVFSGEETARRALRQVRRMALSGQRGPFVVRCAPQTAVALSGYVNTSGCDVYALAANGRHAEKFDIEQMGIALQIPQGAVKLKKE